jgi:uncharacterized membrane protein YbhN (UPF0104 family)
MASMGASNGAGVLTTAMSSRRTFVPCSVVFNMNNTKQGTSRPWLWLMVKIVVSCILLIWLSKKISFPDAARHLLQADIRKLILAFILLGMSLALTALRWHFSSTRLIQVTTALRYTWISQFYGLFLPGATSADIAKGVAMTANRDSQCVSTLASSIVLERFAGLGCIVILGLLAHSLQPIVFHVSRTLTASAALLGLVLLILFPTLLRRILCPFQKNTRLSRFHDFAQRLDGNVWSKTILLSFAIVATNVTFYWTVYHAVGGEALWFQMATYTCLDNLLMLLPISVGGVGIRESLSVALFAEGGEGVREVAFAWIVLFLGSIHGLIGFFLHSQHRREKRNPDVETPPFTNPHGSSSDSTRDTGLGTKS